MAKLKYVCLLKGTIKLCLCSPWKHWGKRGDAYSSIHS